MDLILQHFHHIHHKNNKHQVHHCGGSHKGLNYIIEHCQCGKHQINEKRAIGHDFEGKEIEFEFNEECESGGWHIESGKKGK